MPRVKRQFKATELCRQRPPHAQCAERRGASGAGRPPDHAQHVKKRAGENTCVRTWTGEQLVETTQALDESRHHTAKTVRVRRSRGETDALAGSDVGDLVQFESASQLSG